MLFTSKIKELREQKNIPQKRIAAALDIDTPMYSRIERGERPAKREQVVILSKIFDVEEDMLINQWMAEKLFVKIKDEKNPQEILKILEQIIIRDKKNDNK